MAGRKSLFSMGIAVQFVGSPGRLQHSYAIRPAAAGARFSAQFFGQCADSLVPLWCRCENETAILDGLSGPRLHNLDLPLSTLCRTSPRSGQQPFQRFVWRTCRPAISSGKEQSMKIASPNKLAFRLRHYFTDHLPRVRGTSVHTVHSYRDSLLLFLRFLASQRKCRVHELDLGDIEPDQVIAFLAHLEEVRNNGVTTRNVRLAAIHAFFRYLGTYHPEHLDRVQRILCLLYTSPSPRDRTRSRM